MCGKVQNETVRIANSSQLARILKIYGASCEEFTISTIGQNTQIINRQLKNSQYSSSSTFLLVGFPRKRFDGYHFREHLADGSLAAQHPEQENIYCSFHFKELG